MLVTQARWPDIAVEQAQEAALALAYARSGDERSKNWLPAIDVLIELAQRPNLSFEDAMILDYQRALPGGNKALRRQQYAAKKQMCERIVQRADLTPEQRAEAEQAIRDYTSFLKRR